MSDDSGELSPGTSPSQPSSAPSSPASSPPSSPSFEQRRAAQRSPAGPSERRPAAPNPNATRPSHWSDPHTGEGRAIAAARARRAEAERTGSAAPAAPGEPQPAAGEPRHKVGDFELSESEWRDLAAHKAAQDSRKLTLPKEEADYRLELPEDFVIPQGVELKLDESNPAVGLARKFAIKAGLTQEQFGELAAIYAADRIGHIQQMQRLMSAEKDKLGASGTPRVSAVFTFLDAMLGPELAEPFKVSMVTARQVAGWEKLMRAFESQGVRSISTAHREPPASNGRIEGFDRMSFEQKRAAQSRWRDRS
jgi:hypothetical protein